MSTPSREQKLVAKDLLLTSEDGLAGHETEALECRFSNCGLSLRRAVHLCFIAGMGESFTARWSTGRE